MQATIPEWSQCLPLVGLFPGDDVVQDNAEAVHVHSIAGRVYEADQFGRHVRWGASLQTQNENIIIIVIVITAILLSPFCHAKDAAQGYDGDNLKLDHVLAACRPCAAIMHCVRNCSR